MRYSRAGLVALVFALIISLVSALPLHATEPRLSSTLSPRINLNINGKNHIQVNPTRILEIPLSGRMSTLPLATRLTRRVLLLSIYLLLSINFHTTGNSD